LAIPATMARAQTTVRRSGWVGLRRELTTVQDPRRAEKSAATGLQIPPEDTPPTTRHAEPHRTPIIPRWRGKPETPAPQYPGSNLCCSTSCLHIRPSARRVGSSWSQAGVSDFTRRKQWHKLWHNGRSPKYKSLAVRHYEKPSARVQLCATSSPTAIKRLLRGLLPLTADPINIQGKRVRMR